MPDRGAAILRRPFDRGDRAGRQYLASDYKAGVGDGTPLASQRDEQRDLAMTPERWERVKDVLAAALELPPEERGDWLGRACAGDGELRSEIELLLQSEQVAG